MTKKLGVKYCISLIEDSDKNIINSYKKKDDLADAFLHGFKYLFNPIPIKYFKKMEGVGFEINTKKQNKEIELNINTKEKKQNKDKNVLDTKEKKQKNKNILDTKEKKQMKISLEKSNKKP